MMDAFARSSSKARSKISRGLCTSYETDGQEQRQELDEAAIHRIQEQFAALGRDGYRVLGIAWREVEQTHSHAIVDDETELVFAGFAAFLDPPKESAGPVLRALADSGVAVKNYYR
jgi:Mg2+-importing ATPase